MPRRSMDGVRIHLLVTKPQHKMLTKLSESTGLPMSELLRRAIDSYVKEHKNGN
jgi:predicted DNA-binding protein